MTDNVTLELITTFSTLLSTMRSALRHALKAQGYMLTPPDIRTLSVIAANPGMSLQKLVAISGKDKSQVTRKIKELEDKQLLRKQKHPNDQRSLQLFLTVEGKRVKVKTEAIRAAVHQQFFSRLDQKEQIKLIQLMQKCLGEI